MSYWVMILQLIIGLIIDIIGMITLSITDVGYGLVGLMWIILNYGSVPLGVFNYVEEVLFLDAIPTCTIAWINFYFIGVE